MQSSRVNKRETKAMVLWNISHSHLNALVLVDNKRVARDAVESPPYCYTWLSVHPTSFLVLSNFPVGTVS